MQALADWFNKPNRKPLILRGARQVGKSTLVRFFAQEQGLRFWEVNFERFPALAPLFATRDPQRILMELPLILSLPKGGPDLIFFDEIQEIPEALVCLRYFYEELPHLPIIAAGSLLEFTLSETELSMPVGRVEYLWLYPLDFFEFLRGVGDGDLAEFLNNWTWKQEILDPLHRKCLARLRDFFIVGGMPEAVQVFANTGQYTDVRDVHGSILQTYKDDFSKYTLGAGLEKIRSIFEKSPQLIGEKITYRSFHPDWKAADIRTAIELLVRAGILIKVIHSDASGLPLGGQEHPTIYKPYFLDVGLVITSWNTDDIQLTSFIDGKFFDEGALSEQFCAQTLLSHGKSSFNRSLYYWLREGKSTNAEVDFLITLQNTLIPVEIKSGTSGKLRSLHQFVAQKSVPHGLRLDSNRPSIQRIETEVMTGTGKNKVEYTLFNMPLYLLPGKGWQDLDKAL